MKFYNQAAVTINESLRGHKLNQSISVSCSNLNSSFFYQGAQKREKLDIGDKNLARIDETMIDKPGLNSSEIIKGYKSVSDYISIHDIVAEIASLDSSD